MSWERHQAKGIVMQRIKWVDERLQQWAQWRLSGSSGYRSPAYHECSARYTSDPVNSYIEFSAEQESQALAMDMALAALPPDLRKVVVAFYTWEGGMLTITEKLHVTRATVHRRLCHADIRISGWFDERREQEHKSNRYAVA